jgi:hypothetical protein
LIWQIIDQCVYSMGMYKRRNVGNSSYAQVFKMIKPNIIYTSFYNRFLDTYMNNYKRNDKQYETLYHYTKMEAAIEILDSGDLWLSNHKNLNDYSEISLAFDIFKAALRAMLYGINEPLYNQIINQLNVYNIIPKYIFSLTRSEDSLCQYRSYGEIAVGFDPINLTEKTLGIGELLDVIYNEKEQYALIWKIVVSFFEIYDSKSKYLEPIIINDLFELIDLFSPMLKNSHFEYENETRIIIRNDQINHITLRKYRDRLILHYRAPNPYTRYTNNLPYHYEESIFRKFIAGPMVTKDRLDCFENYLLKNENRLVESSYIPYRQN